LNRLGETTAVICAAMLLELAEAVTVGVVYAVFLMVFVAVTAAVAAVLATVARLVLTSCSFPDVSGAVYKGVVDGNLFAACYSAESRVSDCVGRRGNRVMTYVDSAIAVENLS